MARLILFLILCIIVLTFSLYNLEKTIRFRYFLGYETPPLPVYLLIIAAFFFGMFFTVILVFPQWIKNRSQLKKNEKSFQRLESELRQRMASSEEKRMKSSPIDEDKEI